MKMSNSQKGFTLIELLIVIAIIAVLAVAFLPTILGAPAKGRDTARIADLQKIQKVLVSANLENTAYPATGCVDDTTFAAFKTGFGGKAPVDPQTTNVVKTKGTGAAGCTGKYSYELKPSASYSFGVYAKMEKKEAGNVDCDNIFTDPSDLSAKPSADADSCYAVLTQ